MKFWKGVFSSFSAVFPLQLLHIGQTYVILCSCSTEISQQNTLFNMWIVSIEREQKILYAKNPTQEMF